jgi:hypothetical protein
MERMIEADRMTGNQYATLICRYICANFGDRGLSLYTQVVLGKSIIGKDRTVDVLIVEDATRLAFVLECKYQATQGTVDEKIPYTLDDLRAMRTPGSVVYAGTGFSDGILHLLRASDLAAYCLPDASLARTRSTWELDHVLAQRFGWWDIIVKDSRRFQYQRS